jgi:hypothetical protein
MRVLSAPIDLLRQLHHGRAKVEQAEQDAQRHHLLHHTSMGEWGWWSSSRAAKLEHISRWSNHGMEAAKTTAQRPYFCASIEAMLFGLNGRPRLLSQPCAASSSEMACKLSGRFFRRLSARASATAAGRSSRWLLRPSTFMLSHRALARDIAPALAWTVALIAGLHLRHLQRRRPPSPPRWRKQLGDSLNRRRVAAQMMFYQRLSQLILPIEDRLLKNRPLVPRPKLPALA